MPPELLYAEPYGLPGDIWSLGCVLYSLIALEPPFWHEETDVRNRMVCRDRLEIDTMDKGIMSEMSPECKDLIKRMLRKDQDRRLTID